MNPLSATYAAVRKSLNLLYDSGHFSGHLRGPVVSVGSLSAGGAGKTPFVIALGQLLKQAGIKFDVLSRGYGRETRDIRPVDPDGTAAENGDEPLLIARKLGVPVIVGANRYFAGQFAEQKFGPQMHLLDDGFQHRGLARDFDIVLLTEKDLDDKLFPMGRLREPLSSLQRAHAVVLMDEAQYQPPAYKLLWRARRGIRIGDTPPRQIAFCGIARPQRFFRDLRQAGLEPLGEVTLADHYRYREADVEKLLRVRQEHQASGFVTTEKDLINLGVFAQRLQPLHTVTVKMEIEDATQTLGSMLAEIEGRSRSFA